MTGLRLWLTLDRVLQRYQLTLVKNSQIYCRVVFGLQVIQRDS